jgi:hypothetical protein
MSTVGYVVGEVRTDEFTFVTNREIAPPRLEYIVVPVQEPTRQIDVLAQVTSLSVSSRLLNTSLGYTEVEAILNRLKSSPPIVQGTAKVLGFIDEADNNKIKLSTPRRHARHRRRPRARRFASQVFFRRRIVALKLGRSSIAITWQCMLNPNGSAPASRGDRANRCR